MLDILGRVATRPNPKVSLGPVDMTASFVVVDTTKPDHPIVHVSPGFTHLTGYTESEILGRNCRFLQAPPDKSVEKGSLRHFTDQDAVAKLSQYLSQNNECQVSLVNYRKSGKPFINCLTVIPLCLGPSSEARYHVGFQVDLATQPRAIMDSVKNGTYIVNYTATHAPTGSNLLSRLITQDMMGVLGSIYPEKAGKQFDETRDREDLSKALVRFATGAYLSPYLPIVFQIPILYPDPILVLSLKGHFLYVSPSVSRLFGYDEDWFAGKNLTDLCHPSDHVATMRALKETSPTSGRPTLNNDNEPSEERPGTVHLLFRARINTNTNSGGNSSAGGKEQDKDTQEYIWVECPSRLHTDGARGRKAVIVHVRRREVPRVSWSSINASDGIARDDVWIRIARDERALVLDASENALRVLGRTPDELVGASLMDFLVDDARSARKDALRSAIARAHSASAGDEVAKTAWCNMPVADRRARRDIPSEEDVAAEEKHTTDEGTRTGSAPVPGPKLAVATFEIAIFPPKTSTSPIADESGAWRSTPHSMICRLRVKSKREAADANHTNHGSKVHPPQQQAYSGSGSGSATVDPSTFTPVHPFSYSYLSSVGPSTSTSSSTAKLSGSLMSVRAPNSNAVKVLRTGNATDVVDSAGASSTAAEPTPTIATLCAGMDSSWQYELSLLRNRNEKLRADVGIMEKERKARRRHRRKVGSLSVGAPAGARLIHGAGVGGVSASSGLGLGLSQQQWLVQQQQQQQQAHLHEEASKAGKLAGDVHMALPGEEHLGNLKRTREMAGFEIGAPPPPTWNPGGRSWGV